MRDRPLEGVRVVVTRARDQAASLVDALEGVGAVAVEIPVIEIVDPPDGGAALRAGLAALEAGDWLVLTSPNGATRVRAALGDGALAAGVSVGVIGPGTRLRAEAVGLHVDLVPDSSIGEGFLEFVTGPGAGGGRVLLARAEVARDVLPRGLAAKGWTVDDVAAYSTVGIAVGAEGRDACRHADVVAFTSSSTVVHLVEEVGADNLPPIVACIGPATSEMARGAGVHVHIDAPVHTIPGLIDAIVAALPGLVMIRPERADSPDSQWLLEQYYAEIDQRFETGLDRDAALTTEVDEISPPNGLFLAARLSGKPVGCGVLKIVEPGVADIKRMWVSDLVRGRGVGRRLLRRLVNEARALGLRQVRLETNRVLAEAIALYETEGFVEVEPFNDEPHADRWFVMDLL